GYTDWKPSPGVYLSGAVWNGTASATKYIGAQTQGLCSGAYGLALRSTDNSSIGWIDGKGGLSIGTNAVPSAGIATGIINADAGFTVGGNAAPFVPIGAILAWARDITSPSIPLPAGFHECDGSVVTINGHSVTLPNLNAGQYFLRGSTMPSGTFSPTHNHGIT